MTGTCEVAFDMIESIYLQNDQKIVGLYEAALPGQLAGGREQSQLAQYLCEQIVTNQKEAVFIQVKPDLASSNDDDVILKQQMKNTKGLLFRTFTVNPNGSIQVANKKEIDQQLSEMNNADTEYIVKTYVRNQQYLNLYDFDDHFADIATCDWRN